jgi:nucleoid DNA-binding protein
MVVLSKEELESKTVSRAEVDEALNKIFTEMNQALAEKSPEEVTRDKVDETLNALFEAINQSKYEGKKTKVPDFKRIINGEF